MSGDPLYRPLGMHRRGASPVWMRPAGWAVAMVLMVAAAGVLTWGVRRGQTGGGDPAIAVAKIEQAPVKPPPSADALVPPTTSPKVVAVGGGGPQAPASSVEVQNGVKIIRFNAGGSSSPVTIPVDGQGAVTLRSAPDTRVSERTADGVLPRIGPGGSRPAAVYARPMADTGDALRIAVVLTGMGVDQLATADAARRLPGGVDFAFAPDVPDGAAQVAEVRRAGHEVILDLRGPNTEGGGSRTLLRRMAAWPGYVGALLASDSASADGPVIDARGVTVLVETRTVAVGVPVVRADLVIDAAAPDASANLDRVLALARAKGTAIAIVDAAAKGQDAVASFATSAGRQGVALVPVSALTPDGQSGRGAAK